MLQYLIALVSSLFMPSGETSYIDILGRCAYSEAASEVQDGTVLVQCSLLRTAHEDPVTYDFRHRSFGSSLKFSGELHGDTLTVHTITFRNGETLSVDGQCQTYYANGEVSVVTCLASNGARHFAANFVPSPF